MGALSASQPVNTQALPAGDRANVVVSGTFTAATQKSTDAALSNCAFMAQGPFNVILFGLGSAGPNGNWNGTVRLERSFDAGTTWVVCGIGGSGQQAIWNTPNQDVSVIVGECEDGVIYRLNCTALASGTVGYRMSTTGGAARSLAIASSI